VTALSVVQFYIERHFSKGWGRRNPKQQIVQRIAEEEA